MSGMGIGSGNSGGIRTQYQPRKTENAGQTNQSPQKVNELEKNKEMAASALHPAQGPRLSLIG